MLISRGCYAISPPGDGGIVPIYMCTLGDDLTLG